MGDTNIILMIKELSPETDTAQSVEEATLDAIYACSSTARRLCVGESFEFCTGVLNALYLHKTGRLEK